MKRTLLALAFSTILPTQPQAQSVQPVQSFSYASSGCTYAGTALMFTFGPKSQWQMAPYAAKPGAGEFSTLPFWIRHISAALHSSDESSWAIIGHGGRFGDWVSGILIANKGDVSKPYPSNAAPYFETGDYLDAHFTTSKSTCDSSDWLIVSVDYILDRR